jgi:hypothetical protein
MTSIQVMPDGSFTLFGVATGRYTLCVNQPYGSTTADAEFARVPVTVGVTDISGITVMTQRGATLRGRVLFDTGQPPSNLQPRSFYISPYNADAGMAIGPGRTTMEPDWTFETTGVVATALLRPNPSESARTGWWVKSVLIDGRDYAETPFTFEAGRDYRDIQITLTQKRATVTGTVVDEQDRATNEYAVVVFPEDGSLRFPRSLLMLSGQPNPQGRFTIGTLPAGRFLIAAVPNLAAGQEKDIAFLEKLAPRATRVTLGEGESKS